MEYIDKRNDAASNPKIDNYLSTAKSEPWYGAKELYSHFGSVPEKNDLIDNVLLPEQEHRCCYCMRRLPDHTYGTIEHIIRQSIPNAQAMSKYFRLCFTGLNASNICHTDDYVANRYSKGQYPHKVAYHNFVMACPTCNNARGQNDIEPLFLYAAIRNQVHYDRCSGEMDWPNDPENLKAIPTERPTIEKVELNKPLLKAIRSVWFYAKNHPENPVTPTACRNSAEKAELIYNAFGDALLNPEFTIEDLNGFLMLMKDEFWKRLLMYDYFGSI